MNPTDKRRHGVNEVLPGKLYQRGHFLTWSHAAKQELIHRLGVNVVVNLWRPVDSDMADSRNIHHTRKARGVPAIYLNWHMETDYAPDEATALVGFLVYLLRRGHVVLVHCEAGRNRSAWLCARLVREFMRVSGRSALDIVKDAVPNSAINPNLVQDVLDSDLIWKEPLNDG